MGLLRPEPEHDLLPCACGQEPVFAIADPMRWYVGCNGCENKSVPGVTAEETAREWNVYHLGYVMCSCGEHLGTGWRDGSYWIGMSPFCNCSDVVVESPSAPHVVEMWHDAHNPPAILCSCCGEPMLSRSAPAAFTCSTCSRIVMPA